MTEQVAHRGPDDHGYHLRARVGLGHRRLSIVDRALGHQPLSNEDGSVWIVYNGEVYNHVDLRRELTARGHEVIVQSGAGGGIFADDETYVKAGARIVPSAEDVFAEAEMIVKVKEPQAVEYRRLKSHQILFTYLHLAPDPEQARGLMESGATAIAYETVTDAHGGLHSVATSAT